VVQLRNGERRHRVNVLACQVQGLATGDDELGVRRLRHQRREVRRRRDHLLEIVDDDEHRLLGEIGRQRLARRGTDTERLCDCR